MKGNKTYNSTLHSLHSGVGKLLLTLCLMMASMGAWAADYVIAYVNGGTTYYLARNGTTGVQRVTTFNPTTCVWSCEDENGTPSTLNNSNTYGWLYQTVNGTKYYLRGYYNDLTTDKATGNNNTTRWRTDGNTYVYNRYSNNNSYFINLQNGVARANTASGTCARSYLVSTGGTDFSVSISYPSSDAYIGNVGGTMNISAQVSGNYAPAYYHFNNKYYYTTNGTTYTEANNAPQVSQFNYKYEIISGGDNASITGSTVTYTKDAGEDVEVTVRVTATPQGYASVTRTDECTFTLRSATLAVPTITRITGTNQYEITYPAGATARYSTDGTNINEYASNGTEYSDIITVTTPGAIIKARAVRDGVVSAQTEYIVSDVILDAPVISITDDGTVTITNPNDFASDATIYYTTNGSEPTTSSSAYGASFKVSNGATIKAIISKAGYTNSEVAEKRYSIESGVNGGTVTINDYEDHNWTYYQSTQNLPAGYPAYLSSPDPRNVKITYRGGSVNNASEVAISGLTGEGQNEMIYYKTLEKTVLGMNGNYPYQVISNPFSKRPRTNGSTGTNGYFGFAGWKVISGGEYIQEHANNDVLGLDEIIHFTNLDNNYTPNCTSGEIVFEATWTAATVKTGNSAQSFTGGTYETNFWVITGNTGNISLGAPCTMSARYPDGSSAGNYSIGTGGGTTITTTVDNVKIEFLNLNTTGNISADGRNFTMGRGITWSRTAGRVSCGNRARAHTVKIESGKYGSLYHFTAGVSGAATDQLVILGNDYDRAKNDNAKLEITGQMIDANANTVTGVASQCYVRSVVKSGSFMTDVSVGTGAYTASYYFGGYGSNNRHVGRRFLTIEGGEFTGSVCGGTDDSDHGATARAFDLRVRGNAVINGAVYGGAENAQCYGVRTMIFTGGTVKGWVCAAANGTSNTNGDLTGTTYLYMGGNARVDSNGSHTVINRSVGGNVFAAGCGYQANNATSGLVRNGTNLVVADNTYIERGAYGGGSYGYSLNTQTTNIFITGGHVAGKNGGVNGTNWDANVPGGVYGGACQNAGGTINITMTGGLVEGGLYGGSNVTGTIAGKVTMQIDGGQVGTTTTAANVHGGGLGQPTRVNNDVEITLGKTGAARDADGVTVWGDVYGGSALGYVNGTTAADTYHTNVTMNAGYIHGSLYGGALGDAGTAANVYGPVQVKVYGGSVFNTDGTGANGSGAVYGANNINGAPQRSVTVDIYGTNSAPAEDEYALFSVYGGGNAADYTYGNGYPKVTVHNCDNSIEYVYGGGNAAAVAATDVTIYGGDKIGNVFGGGNGQVRAANVTGGTNVKIYGGTIGDVYGGSNTNGTIGGTISVNVNAQAEPDHAACPINIDNVYGGGNKAPSAAGNVTIGCAEHIGAVYGGANQANINGNINLSIVSGHIDNVFGGNNTSGNISGTITVTVNDNNSSCGMLVGNVYGGGNKAAYGTGTNYPVVNIQNGHLTGSVFGGGLGETAVVNGNPQVTIGQATGTVTIDGDVYGGGDAGNVEGVPVVTVVNNCNNTIANLYGGGNAADVSGTNVTINGGTFSGMVFGGGHGDKDAMPQKEANVNGNVVLTITGGTIDKVFAGSNSKGNITGTANLRVNKGASSCPLHITELYGGGNEAAGNAGTISIQNTGTAEEGIGTVYGGANNADINSDIALNITGGNIGDIFGGNNNGGQVKGNITVDINWSGTGVNHVGNVYGGGNIASIDNGTPRTVTVNIPNAEVSGSVFGGGKGKEAVIVGSTNVNLGSWTAGAVTIAGTDATHPGDVFGGGDLAAVEGPCNITIRDCNTLITGDLYGGGNAAPVYSTNTTMWGGTVAGNVFGGGNGKDATLNAKGAQVGYQRDDLTAGTGEGKATTNIFGGTVGTWTGDGNAVCTDGTGGVFGGSNTNGNIRGGIALTLDQRTCGETGATQCGLKLREIYGAGNEAAYAGTGINFDLGCVDYLEEIYGGAKAADLNADAVLTIRSGHFKKVFGGNNVSGKLNGKIEVNVDETGCNPVVIEELYGGGNQAAYSVYGYEDALVDGKVVVKTTGDKLYADPQVNIISCTRIDNIYGGGYGAPATMVGNPTVNINQIKGRPNGVESATLGAIGIVYGGGNAAKVVGSTTVNVGTATGKVKHISGDDQTTEYDAGANITGNVYGGGNQADVTGKTNVTIGR